MGLERPGYSGLSLRVTRIIDGADGDCGGDELTLYVRSPSGSTRPLPGAPLLCLPANRPAVIPTA
jgi:hypothetical protein